MAIDFNSIMRTATGGAPTDFTSQLDSLLKPQQGIMSNALQANQNWQSPYSFLSKPPVDATPAPSGGNALMNADLGDPISNFLNKLTAGIYARGAGAAKNLMATIENPTVTHEATNPFEELTQSLGMFGKAAYQGFTDPLSAYKNLDTATTARFGNDAPAHLVTQAMSDPLMVAPVGEAAKAIDSATGISKGANFLYDLARGGLKTPATTDAGKTLDDILGGVKAPLSDAEAADINARAGLDGGYVPPEAPPAAPKFTINNDPNAYLDNVIGKIKTDVYQTITPPYENPKELANYVSQFSGFEPKEVSSLPYEDLRQLAEEIHGNVSSGDNFLNIGKQAAANQGFNLDDLFAGKAPNITDRVAQDAQKRVYGIYPDELPPVSNPFLKPKPPETGFEMKYPLDIYRGPVEEATPSLGKFADTYGLTSEWGNKMAENLAAKFPNGIPGLKQPLDLLGNMFKKYYGATPVLDDTLKSAEAGDQYDTMTIKNAFSNMEQSHGLSNADLYDVIRVLEGTKTADQVSPEIAKAAEDLKNSLENGVTGITSGTKAEIGTTLPNNQRVLGQVIDNYFPHVYKNSTEDVNAAFERAPNDVRSVKGSFNKERKFDSIDKAIAAGLKPEINPYRAIEDRLIRSARSIRRANILNDMVNNPAFEHYTQGSVSEAFKNAKTGQEVGYLPKNFVQSKLAELGGRYINQADEAALQQFLNPGRRWLPQNKALAAPIKAYDWLTQAIKQGTYTSMAPHLHNIMYNGGYLGGADIGKALGKAFDKSLDTDPIVQRAIKAGAISADTHHNVSGITKLMSTMTLGLTDKSSAALWKMDKAIRAQLFEQAVGNGLKDSDAAKLVNKFMVDYNNLTPFEENVMQRVFPFYRWLKGNMALQLNQWLTNPMKQQLATKYVPDAISQMMSGQNSHDGKVDTGVDAKGNHHLVDLYMPGAEVPKMMRDGILPFLYGKTNGAVKFGESLVNNNKYYPNEWVAPNGKETMAAQDSGNKVILRGDGIPASYNAGNVASLFARDMVSPLSGAVGTATDAQQQLDSLLGKDKNTSKSKANVTDDIAKVLGMFTSQYNPKLEEKYNKRITQSEAKDYLQYLYSTGQTPTKLDKRNAYKPIK